MNLRAAVGFEFQGAIIRTDDNVDLCQDCANRCLSQMVNCVGFVLEPRYDNNPQFGRCTYFSRIDAVKASANDRTLSLATAAQIS